MTLGGTERTSVLAAAAAAASLSALTHVENLADSGRTAVWRVTDGLQSYVLKVYIENEENTWAREASALEAVGSSASPLLVGVCADPQLIVMSDVGTSASLADVLLGDDALVAASTVQAWAGALARLHQTPAEVVSLYEVQLSRRAPQQSVHDKPRALGEAADQLHRLAPGFGVDVSDDATARLNGLPSAFAAQMNVLSPGDTCPDNNLVHTEGVTFLDFEFAEVRHLAWDVAYLRVPWPTCWCAWQLPPEVAESAVEHYRSLLAPTSSYAGSSDFDHDVDLAVLGWSLESSAMFLQGALAETAAHETTARRPGRRPLVLNRLAQAATMTVDPVLANVADRLHAALLREWGAQPLELAPAFAGHGQR